MDEYQSLSHTRWECKYHVVFIPKCRRKTLYGELRRHLGEVFRKLAVQKESKIEEGHLMPDHVHMMISIPSKYAVSQVIGYIKGKSAIHLARVYGERKRNFVGQHFWARGYFVSTIGRDEAVIREYIQNKSRRTCASIRSRRRTDSSDRGAGPPVLLLDVLPDDGFVSPSRSNGGLPSPRSAVPQNCVSSRHRREQDGSRSYP